MTHHQPTYDFLSGAPSPHRRSSIIPQKAPPPHSSIPVRTDHSTETLRTQVRTLQYELDALKQERELHTLESQSEIREVQARAEADYKRALDAERARDTAVKKVEGLAREVQDVRIKSENERGVLEKRIRGLGEESRGLREEVEELRGEGEEGRRVLERRCGDLEERLSRSKGEADEAEREKGRLREGLSEAHERFQERERRVGELEEEVLGLKSREGDRESLDLVRKELGEQVEYIRRLEGMLRDQGNELKRLKGTARSVEVVEEEKRGLEAKVRIMEDLRRELAEAQLQRCILEDEKRGWRSYLQNEGAGEEVAFETPEEMAKAFMHERLERLELVDRLGAVQPELNVREENIRALQDDKAALQSELDALRSAASRVPATVSAPDAKARARLERQKNLAIKEVEYLRAQMKTFEAEEAQFNAAEVDEAHAKRVQELEDLLQQHRTELETLHADLSALESHAPPPVVSPNKRPREDDETDSSHLVGELRRKTRALQDELTTTQHRASILEADLRASTTQLSALRSASSTRTLELRSNPTADYERVKLSTLHTLRSENTALLAQLEGVPHSAKVVPISTLDATRLQLTELQDTIKGMEKKSLRLKQIFSSKSLEFREAVASILGWKLDFQPNGRVKCTSILYPTHMGAEGEEVENSITFDGEQGTMKVSGGPKSVFAGEIRESVEFWVEGRREVPGLLAALTLEFYEKQTAHKI
ncbi:hypothetical protein B0A48_03353 [Cryoendolithus antarcticus]|uniref:Spindle assembly checkpoint component MAD1 n=1 Tax=Cryoendolithus antarcticus TaxID=1507870 RepID=A0A1V8TJR8_9PEZI|nr:hypothetical protein B0A48_03353 [Cryoendolithus antarcticus]